MAPAREPRDDLASQRLLHVDRASGALTDRRISELPSLVRPGDVWVLNDAATLPASLAGRAAGRDVELRLASALPSGRWLAVLFGEGSWRDDTDRRPAPPRLEPGDRIVLGEGLSATVRALDPGSPRLLEVRFEPGGDAFWRALYALGRPVQYSYLAREVPLGRVQTGYAARPWAMELPSAGRPLSSGLLARLRSAGARIATLTHAAGLSATGDAALDARLPLPERFDIPTATARAIADALDEERRVVAVGTSVTRALEGSALAHGVVRAGEGETDLVIGPGAPLRVVGALLTGAHDPTSSHYALLRAFAPDPLLERAVTVSEARGYLGHELGDSWLIT
jgi:S-adenosylmethionine:tRNA ribosyltransferase-isomerase